MGDNRRKTHGGNAAAAGAEWLAPALLLPGLLLLTMLSGADVIQSALPWLLGLAIAAVAVQFARGRLRPAVQLPALAVLAYLGVLGLSTFVAVSGKFAMKEYSNLLLAFVAYLLVSLLLADDGEKRERRIRAVLAAVSGATAVLGLVSVDATLGGAFARLAAPLTGRFLAAGGVETNVRIVSILGNPNVFAGVVGIGVFAALALVSGAKTTSWRRVGILLLELNAMSFLLAFSMGGSMAIAFGFLLTLLVTQKEARGTLFLTMAETLVVTLVFSFAVFPSLDGVSAMPLALTALACGVLLALDMLVTPRLTALFSGRGKGVVIVLAALAALAIGFLVLALTLTGGAQLGAGETLRRAAYPERGGYTLTTEGTGALDVVIESQDKRETVIHSSTVLYSGPASDAAFTVPDGALVVYFNFTAPEGATLERAAWTGETDSGTLPLRYTLLPGFIANRLQGLRANENAIQRFAFFSDGLKLFARNPILGGGVGSFENGVMSVQDFYYETSAVHNHYIQALCDAGILGLAAFLFLLAAMARALLRARKKEGGGAGLIPALSGCLLFMAVHAGVEVVFSDGVYLLFAFAAFALMGAQGEPVEADGRGKALSAAAVIAVCAFCALFAFLWMRSGMAARLANSGMSDTRFFLNLEEAAKMDRYNRNDYLVSYVVNSVQTGQEEILAQADVYAEELAEVKSNSVGQYLTGYYLVRGENEAAFRAALRSVEYTKSSPNAWNEMFETLSGGSSATGYLEDPEGYQNGLQALCQRFEAVSAEQIDHPALNDASLLYLQKMEALRDIPAERDKVEALFHTVFDLGWLTDGNGDGRPEGVELSGEASWDGASLRLGAGAELTIRLDVRGMALCKATLSAQGAVTVTEGHGSAVEAKDGAYEFFVSDAKSAFIKVRAESGAVIDGLSIVKA